MNNTVLFEILLVYSLHSNNGSTDVDQPVKTKFVQIVV